MSKWTTTAGPIQTKWVNEALKRISWEGNTFKELTGVIGGAEDSHVYTQLCGGGREDCNAALTRIGEALSWTITRENYQQIIEMVETELPALKANRPVRDKRETAEAAAARLAEQNRAREERENRERAKEEAFLAAFAEVGDVVQIPQGQTLVTLQLCYDDSDSQSDYFNRHANLGPALLLAVAPKQAETERLARSVVERYDWLRDISFKWHTEKYSMGHGNYLESGGHELPEALKAWSQQYRGGSVTHAYWEIEFSRSYNPMTMRAAKGYLGTGRAVQPVANASHEVSVTFNSEKFGVEIRFPAKPDTNTLAVLKANGWRWSRFSSCWYTKAGVQALEVCSSLGALTDEQRAEIEQRITAKAVQAGDHGMEVACGIA